MGLLERLIGTGGSVDSMAPSAGVGLDPMGQPTDLRFGALASQTGQLMPRDVLGSDLPFNVQDKLLGAFQGRQARIRELEAESFDPIDELEQKLKGLQAEAGENVMRQDSSGKGRFRVVLRNGKLEVVGGGTPKITPLDQEEVALSGPELQHIRRLQAMGAEGGFPNIGTDVEEIPGQGMFSAKTGTQRFKIGEPTRPSIDELIPDKAAQGELAERLAQLGSTRSEEKTDIEARLEELQALRRSGLSNTELNKATLAQRERKEARELSRATAMSERFGKDYNKILEETSSAGEDKILSAQRNLLQSYPRSARAKIVQEYDLDESWIDKSGRMTKRAKSKTVETDPNKIPQEPRKIDAKRADQVLTVSTGRGLNQYITDISQLLSNVKNPMPSVNRILEVIQKRVKNRDLTFDEGIALTDIMPTFARPNIVDAQVAKTITAIANDLKENGLSGEDLDVAMFNIIAGMVKNNK